MQRSLAICLISLVVGGLAASASATPHVTPEKAEQKEADRHFKSGVALFKENKFSEALAEFERAYEIAPHPLVLYNIAGCHRELSHYAEAVKFYNRFLTEGKGKVAAGRLTAAQTELDGILARVARVTITVSPGDGATLVLDGTPLGTLLEMPLIVAPGEHKFIASSPGHKDAQRTLRLASGDEVTVELKLADVPAEPLHVDKQAPPPVMIAAPAQHRFSIGAGFGTNLRRASDSGAPSLGLAVAIGSRLELAVDGVLVAYAVMPSVRVRLVGDTLSVHAIAAVPIAITDDNMTKVFVAGALGLGLRAQVTPMLSFHLVALASYAGKDHGTTLPTFIGGELWF